MSVHTRHCHRLHKNLSTLPICPFSTTTRRCAHRKPKKDWDFEAKMPVHEYNQVNTVRNRLYVFGTAFHGGIGLENLMKPKDPEEKVHLFMWKPVRHKFAETNTLTDIAAGHGFSLFATKPKLDAGPIVFGCGKNNFSQIGYQAARRDGPMETLLSIVPLPINGNKDSRVLALGAGRGHSLISISGEGLITLGDNSVGQCGRKIINDEKYFGSKYIHKFTRFQEDEVISIAARFDISICVTRSGKVYTCGSNQKGQLGRGKDVDRPWEFQEVGGDLCGEKVVKVVTSGASALAISDKGELFAWGCNEMGQGDPSEIGNVIYHPKRVTLPRGIEKVTDVAIGDYFSFLLNQQGNVYVWGQGPCLGLGPQNVLVRTPTQIPPPLFGCNQFSPDVQVVSISSSFFYSGAINSHGDLYTWGKDQNGCLGLGKLKYQHFPLKVSMGASAKKLSLGIDHSLIMAKGGV